VGSAAEKAATLPPASLLGLGILGGGRGGADDDLVGRQLFPGTAGGFLSDNRHGLGNRFRRRQGNGFRRVDGLGLGGPRRLWLARAAARTGRGLVLMHRVLDGRVGIGRLARPARTLGLVSGG